MTRDGSIHDVFRATPPGPVVLVTNPQSEHAVGAIVVGYPLRLDGTAGIQCDKVDRFIAALRDVVSVPVIAWDETLSTKEAEGLMREAGVKRKKKRGMVDRIAAAVILQDCLNRKSRRGGGDP